MLCLQHFTEIVPGAQVGDLGLILDASEPSVVHIKASILCSLVETPGQLEMQSIFSSKEL
jgi:hypothetical protein